MQAVYGDLSAKELKKCGEKNGSRNQQIGDLYFCA
jgi:hypothetical protein